MSTVTIEDIPVEYLKCRSFGHAWDEFVPVGKRPGIGFRFSLVCVSCGMERHDGIDVNGNLATREYVQPKGYKLDQGYTRAEFRLVYERKRRKKVLRRGHLTVAN